MFEINQTNVSLLKAAQGIVDGDATRVFEMNKMHPSLLIVPISTHHIQLIAISKNDVFVKKPSDFKNYRIGVVQGVKIAEKLAKELSTRPISAVTDDKVLIEMLFKDEIDIVITNKISLFTNYTHISDFKLNIRKMPLISRPLYMHLHKKHKHLIPRFTKAFKSMIDDGTYQDIQRKFNTQMESKFKKATNFSYY